MTDENAPEKISIMSQYLEMLEMDIDSEERYEDEDWFEGLNKKYKTKSEVMRHSAQQRIRSYYVSAKEQIQREADGDTKELLLDLLEEINNELKSNDFHGSYFDRQAAARQRPLRQEGVVPVSGEVIPTVIEAARTKPKYAELNWQEAYRLLFTKDNLKLVQVGCHKKAARVENTVKTKDFLVT
nr:hypothetical protein BaRGS_027202 [Batillaria attramentaria]